jgi:hypothetical protein
LSDEEREKRAGRGRIGAGLASGSMGSEATSSGTSVA